MSCPRIVATAALREESPGKFAALFQVTFTFAHFIAHRDDMLDFLDSPEASGNAYFTTTSDEAAIRTLARFWFTDDVTGMLFKLSFG